MEPLDTEKKSKIANEMTSDLDDAVLLLAKLRKTQPNQIKKFALSDTNNILKYYSKVHIEFSEDSQKEKPTPLYKPCQNIQEDYIPIKNRLPPSLPPFMAHGWLVGWHKDIDHAVEVVEEWDEVEAQLDPPLLHSPA